MNGVACWRMFAAMRDSCPGDVLCGAFLYAAENGWLLPDLVTDKGVPADEPNAVEKVRARTFNLPADLMLQVLEGSRYEV